MSESYKSYVNSIMMSAMARNLTGKRVNNKLRTRSTPARQNELLVPNDMKSVFAEITSLTDTFCEKFLNDEYAIICRKLTAALCRKRPSPLTKGKTLTWAAGIVYAAGWINFLGYKNQSPYMSTREQAEKFGVGLSTMQSKKLKIQKVLNLIPLDPDYTLSSRLAENPLVWMVEVNGFIIDMRSAPPEFQKTAFEKGLIPFIPEDKEEPGQEEEIETKFPSPKKETARSNSDHKAIYEETGLFDGLEE